MVPRFFKAQAMLSCIMLFFVLTGQIKTENEEKHVENIIVYNYTIPNTTVKNIAGKLVLTTGLKT